MTRADQLIRMALNESSGAIGQPRWLTAEEHGPPGDTGNYGWVHPNTGLHYAGGGGGHAGEARELGFKGKHDWEANEKALGAGYTRWYVADEEIGVNFDANSPDAPGRAKDVLSYHAKGRRGRPFAVDAGPSGYRRLRSLKAAHDFIDHVSTGRKETDFARMKRELGEAFNVKINEPHKLKLRRTGKKYDRENDEHLYDFEIKHPVHGVVATLHGRANTPEPGYHGLNIGALYLSDDFAKKIGAGAEGAWDYETAAGALGVAGIRQIGRELRRHGFTHARTDSRESGVRGRPNNKHNGGGSFGYIDDKPLPETAESLIRTDLNEATLIPHDDNRPGRARYDIEHEGKQIGRLAVQTVDHAPELPAGSRAGKLGVRLNPDARGSRTLVRDVLRQIRDRHPDLTHVGGFRLSGTRARWDNDQKSTTDRYTWVKLRDAIR